ncbi:MULTISPECIES: dihydrofolate reductase family protein [Pseudofrankia]|uniref:dihydrofolate reductase family protein n=1 Tax=Pseudofrankia TaxID=2994363 RepID=UPI000234D2AC|nr:MULTISPECIES: dihydrofolate reductase family protein [Pseudofrankia]OHV34174.1 riboflavin biosynthesis protein RibD [Pseudofrankia sp. EUN1h]
MRIRARLAVSVDGFVTTPTGWPAHTADPAFVSGESHGIREFLVGCEAVLMGRTTFEPALANDRWPWPNLDVFVLGSQLPPGIPDHVVADSDPARLLERIRAANRGGDVHLVGGPRTIEAFRALGALDTLELVVVPLLFGAGLRLTPALSAEAGLTFESSRALPGGSVEIVYTCDGHRADLPARPASQPAPQTRDA